MKNLTVYRDKCRHFTGIQHETCKAGVSYASVRDASGEGMYRWPCLDSGRPCSTTCEKRSLLTQEEHAEHERMFSEAIDAHIAKIKAGVCPECGQAIEPSQIVGACKYAACGHRIGQVGKDSRVGRVASLDMCIAVGFGSAVVLRDGEQVYDGEDPPEDLTRDTEGWLTLETVDRIAERDAGAWEIHIDGPTFSEKFRRESKGRWVCFEAGEGFA